MRNRPLMIWVLALLAISLALPLWQHFGMNRELAFDAASPWSRYVFDDSGMGGNSAATLPKTPGIVTLNCQLRTRYKWPFCAMSFVISPTTRGIDFSRFDSFSLAIRTTGPTPLPIKVYLRNYNPAYADVRNIDSYKVNELQYTPADEPEVLRLPMKNFVVAAWWLTERHISPQEATPEASNITALQIATGDIDTAGDYTIAIREIRFYGKWLSVAQVLGAISVLWIGSALLFLVLSFRQSHRAMRALRLQQHALQEVNTALELERNALETRATRDALTGALNRAGLGERLQAMTLNQQEHGTLSTIFMDIDHFKRVNDEHGHEAGDQVLQAFAQLITRHVRGQDLFCRWGGEEFILLCPGTPLRIAGEVAEKLRALVTAHSWPLDLPISCSFGVAQIESGENFSQFLARADQALYRAKQAGRNRVELHDGAAPAALPAS